MTTLRIEGEVERACELGFAELAALPGQIADAGAVVPGRSGAAVALSSVLEHAGLREGADYLSVTATDGVFTASVPIAGLTDAILVYRAGDAPLPQAQGGPIRMLIPEAASCRSAEIDTCANVKYVASLRVTRGKAADTRPSTKREHAALHTHAVDKKTR